MAVPIEERARNYLAKMPVGVSGSNRHAATFHAAFVLLHGFGLTQEQAWPILCEFNERCDPPSDLHKLRYRLERADRAEPAGGRGFLVKGAKFTPSQTYRRLHLPPSAAPKIEYDEGRLKKFAGAWSEVVDLLWLAARSAEDPCTVDSWRFLELLYDKTREKALIFLNEYSQGESVWPNDLVLPKEGPNGVWFLAQPVDGRYYPNPRSPGKDGKPRMSRRSEESTRSWRYFVIESDKAAPKYWLGAIAQLPLRIAALYTSGSRSVHALVRVDARVKSEWDAERDAMKQALVALGADPGSMSAVRLSRLPGTYRLGKTVEIKEEGEGRKAEKKRSHYVRFEKPGFQKLLYVNPDPPLRPLIELAPRRDVLGPWLRWAAAGVSDSDETNGSEAGLAVLTRALNYYAPVSKECREILATMRVGAHERSKS